MAQGGEHDGWDEQPPWTRTSETGHHPHIPPRRPPATPPPALDWPDQPNVAAPDHLRAAQFGPAPAHRPKANHRRATGGSPRRTRFFAGGLALVLLGVGVYFGIDRWLLDDRTQFTVPTGCAGQVRLRLAVAPEIASLLEQASAEVDGVACPTVATTTLEPGQTATILKDGTFDGMVPASSAWLRLTPSPPAAPPSAPSSPHATPGPSPASVPPDALSSAGKAMSLVRTPIVVAAPRPAAESLGWPQHQPSWAELTAATVAGKLRFSMANPTRDAAGLLAVLGVHTAMRKTTPDQGIAQMRALTLRSRLANAGADPAELLRKLELLSDPAEAAREIGAFPVTEQALWAHQTRKQAVPLAAIYPGDALMEADYPLVLAPAAEGSRSLRDLATRLVERFHSARFAETIREHGFRPATDATAPPDGLPAQYPTAAATPSDPALITGHAVRWAKYERLNFQVLILLDGSGSMNDQVRDRSGKLTTKAALLRTAGVQAAQLFGLDTSVGVWLFATPTSHGPPYVEAVSFGPLDEPLGGVPRREAIRRMAESYSAYERAGTPLNETVLRAVDAMRQQVRPGTVTMVVALTDGRDQDTRFSISRSDFLSRLNAARDPQRPVPVFCIGYGADADMGALDDISRATGGRAAASNDPGDLASAIAQIFLAAHVAQ